VRGVYPAARRGERVDELVELVRAKAAAEGRFASALPGVWFFRFDRPQPPKRTTAETLYLGVAAQGRKHVRVGGRDLVYDRLNYIVLRSDTEYDAQVVEATPARPYLAIGIRLPPDLVADTLLAVVDEHGAGPVRAADAAPAFVSALDDALVDPLCRLLRSLDDPGERRVLAPLALREIVFRLLCTDAAAVLRLAAADLAERARIRQAMAYIADNAARPLSVAALARRVAMSPSHFAHRFREIASVSPMRYAKHVRMERARALLLAEGLAAGAIASRVGYASASHFTRDFKRHFGLAPATYARAFEGRSTVPATLVGVTDAVDA
jgi:AraC-like DNA-binding protein